VHIIIYEETPIYPHSNQSGHWAQGTAEFQHLPYSCAPMQVIGGSGF
jgi:hypothetical protein